MAVYKVPQDVEADDKLIGPFSFRQFIYLIVVAISIAGGWGLSQLFIPLAIIPLPLILFFGALALPLRKDQPMEAYLTAIVSFYFIKSRRRFWEPDGIDSFVTIIAPKNADLKRTKDIGEEEAEKRFSYLAGIVDSHGWAVRGQDVGAPANLSSELYRETADVTDMMDSGTAQSQSLTKMIDSSNTARREQLVTQMHQSAPTTPTPTANSSTATPASAATQTDDTAKPKPTGQAAPTTNPSTPSARAKDNSQGYLTSDQRDAITYALGLAEELEDEKIGRIDTPQALRGGDVKSATPITTSTSATPPSAATIDLATNRPELTVETISKEAQRIKEKEQLPQSEVFISLH
jgi:PrgI family protein